MAAPKKYPDELMDRGVRLVFESGRAIAHVARDLGVSAEARRKRVRRAQVDAGKREGLRTDEREELKQLGRVANRRPDDQSPLAEQRLLLACAQAGDERAFRRLVEPYRHALEVHCYRMLSITSRSPPLRNRR